jgi:hypothetical protein
MKYFAQRAARSLWFAAPCMTRVNDTVVIITCQARLMVTESHLSIRP